MEENQVWKWKRKRSDEDDEDDYSIQKESKLVHSAVQCDLSPVCEKIIFQSYSDYLQHYETEHQLECKECRRNLPTRHLLHLHLLELHDSFFAAKVEKYKGKQDLYECFVDNCPMKSSTNKSRNDHLINYHFYPKTFRFNVILGVQNRIDKKERLASLAKKESMDVDELENQIERMTLVPRTVSFGRKSNPKPISYLEAQKLLRKETAKKES
jgi:hypothetical protein